MRHLSAGSRPHYRTGTSPAHPITRRAALSLIGGAATVPIAASAGASARQPALIRPPRIQPGDVFGLVSPATAAFETAPTEIFADAFRAVGLEPRLGSNYYRRRGYFAGSDAERAADIINRDGELRSQPLLHAERVDQHCPMRLAFGLPLMQRLLAGSACTDRLG